MSYKMLDNTGQLRIRGNFKVDSNETMGQGSELPSEGLTIRITECDVTVFRGHLVVSHMRIEPDQFVALDLTLTSFDDLKKQAAGLIEQERDTLNAMEEIGKDAAAQVRDLFKVNTQD